MTISKKKLDLECADRLENLACYFQKDDAIAQGKMSVAEYQNYMSAIRYAIATLRGGKE